MPMKRSRVRTSEARIIERHAKPPVASTSRTSAPTTSSDVPVDLDPGRPRGRRAARTPARARGSPAPRRLAEHDREPGERRGEQALQLADVALPDDREPEEDGDEERGLRHHARREVRAVVVEAAGERAVAPQRGAEDEQPEQRLHRPRDDVEVVVAELAQLGPAHRGDAVAEPRARMRLSPSRRESRRLRACISEAPSFLDRPAGGGGEDIVERVGRRTRRRAPSGDPWATSPPRSMIAIRSHCRSASSIWCVVTSERRPRLLAQHLEPFPHEAPRGRVEPDGRLVEEQHLRPVQERGRDLEPAQHAARQRAPEPVEERGEVHRLDRLRDPLAALVPRHAGDAAVELEVLRARSARRRSRSPAARSRSAAARRARRARRRARRPSARPSVGRSSVVSTRIVVVLPAPFGPSRPNDLARADRERDAAHRLDLAEADDEIVDEDGGVAHRARSAPRCARAAPRRPSR